MDIKSNDEKENTSSGKQIEEKRRKIFKCVCWGVLLIIVLCSSSHIYPKFC